MKSPVPRIWQVAPSMDIGRAKFGLTATDSGKLVAIGGSSLPTFVRSVAVVDQSGPTSGIWEEKAQWAVGGIRL